MTVGKCLILFGLLGVARTMGAGELKWPADHLLPTFPAAASTIDCIDISHATDAEQDLFASLEGIVNRSQPRIACVYDGTQEGKLEWIKLHDLHYRLVTGYGIVAKYRHAINGLVVTDPARPDTLNLATTMAGLNDELICAPELLSVFTNAPFKFSIQDDLRDRFANKAEVYTFMLTNCWPHCTHRVIAGLNPQTHASLRDYLIAVKSAVVWFNPANEKDADTLKPFCADLKPADCVYMGWWPDEGAGLEFIGKYGVQVLASDFFDNGSLFGGVHQKIEPPPIPPAPPLENKIYVAMILSDGDNIQYMQHHMKEAWRDPARGSVPIGWTVSPLSVDADPGMLNYFYRTATTNDCLVSGPSGAGYARLNYWRASDLTPYAKKTEAYLQRSGIRVITVWNKVTDEVADALATNCPTLVGITDQGGVDYTSMHGNLAVAGFAEDEASYADKVSQMQHAITKASKKWDGTAPVFIIVQGNSWSIDPVHFQKIAAALDPGRFVVVRPDHFFMLVKQASLPR